MTEGSPARVVRNPLFVVKFLSEGRQRVRFWLRVDASNNIFQISLNSR